VIRKSPSPRPTEEADLRALIVDDSRAMRTILGQFLRSLGFQVVEAGDGAEALVRLDESGGADLALVDWNMPVMNGLDFVRAVRRRPAYDSMRMMMVTTETETASIARALEEGANEYVMKPFTREIIAQKLEMMGLQLA
jgi:two-component system chemotaxis response regulator CheY